MAIFFRRRSRGVPTIALVLLVALLAARVAASEPANMAPGEGQALDAPYDFRLSGRLGSASALGLTVLAQNDAASGAAGQDGGARREPGASRTSNALVIGTGIALVAAYGATQWYDDGFSGGFKTVNEQWFGIDTKYGGMDKLGHLGFSYASTRWFTSALRAIGNDDATARNLAALSVVATMTAIEVLDGYSKRWRFSAEDALMNVAGVALGWVFERYPAVDDVIDLRLRYQRSTQPDGTHTSFDPFSDYEGQTYLVVAKASGIPALRENPWLKYLEVSVGYSARGFDPRTPDPKRYFNYGIGLNVGALLEDFVLKNAGAPAKAVNRWFFEYFQLPGTQALGKTSF